MKKIDLTPEQNRKWIETRSALLWTCPAFTHILFSMLNPTNGSLAALFTDEVPIAATDGSTLILNPDGFFAFNLSERVFIVAHEIMHCIYNHCSAAMPMRRSKEVKYADGTKLPFDAQQMNIAMDLVINDMLVNSRIGAMPKVGMYDPKIATQADGYLDVYRKIYKQDKSSATGGFDQILAPGAGQGKDPHQAGSDRSQAAWDTAVAGAIAAAKAQGKLPAALERALGAVINPEVPWQEVIRAFFARKVGSGGYNWRKPDRRLIQRDIYAPERAGNGCGDIVVAIDTSGSIGQRELDVFFAEMRGILDDVRPKLIHVVWCDAQVHKVDEVEDSQDISALKPVGGGGGTDFRPVFDWIDTNDIRPECLVYLTDGYGSFPQSAPTYPLVWGCISGKVKYPFGEVVRVPIKK
jgi:predicted metal-dependent peptidase